MTKIRSGIQVDENVIHSEPLTMKQQKCHATSEENSLDLHHVLTVESYQTRKTKGSDTLESCLSRIEHVLLVKVSFERRKIVKVFMTHVQVFCQKSLSKATFERKLSSVSLP